MLINLPGLFAFLAAANRRLATEQRRLRIALDEYETLHVKIGELANAPWTSYLVSERTIEVPLITLAETTLLLTDPPQQSRFWPAASAGCACR